MESLSPENVKRIAGFLDFKDMVSFSQTRQPFQADLKPLIRKAERVMLKENGKLKTALCSLTRAVCYMADTRRMDHEWQDIGRVLNVRFNFSDLAFRVEAFPGDTPEGVLTLQGGTDDIIVRHFLDQMD